jgi:hypothetical protein
MDPLIDPLIDPLGGHVGGQMRHCMQARGLSGPLTCTFVVGLPGFEPGTS